MATVNSNLVTAQQAALNAKKAVNPLSMAPQSPTSPFALPQPKLSTPAQTPSFGAGTVGSGTGGAPMSVVPPALKSKTVETYHAPASAPAAQSASQNFTTPSGATVNPQGGLVSLPPSFNSAATGLINASQQGSPQARGATQQLQDSVKNNQAIGQQAQDIASNYGQQIAEVGGQGARFVAGQKTTGTTPVAQGNAAITAQTTAQSQQALAEGESAALQGIGYQLTGQGQTQSGLNQAASQGYAGQGLVQSGLNQAAGLLQPTQVPYSNQLLSPATGQPVSGVPSNAFQGGAQVGNYQAGQDYAQMNIANTAAKGIKNTITSYLASNPQLNPSDATFVNSINQWAAGQQLGDPKWQTLSNYLNEYISTLAPVLGVGGNTTDLKTSIAQSMINAKASGASISEVLGNMEKLANDKLANISSAGQGGGTVAGGNTGNAGGATVQTSAGPINTNW